MCHSAWFCDGDAQVHWHYGAQKSRFVCGRDHVDGDTEVEFVSVDEGAMCNECLLVCTMVEMYKTLNTTVALVDSFLVQSDNTAEARAAQVIHNTDVRTKLAYLLNRVIVTLLAMRMVYGVADDVIDAVDKSDKSPDPDMSQLN